MQNSLEALLGNYVSPYIEELDFKSRFYELLQEPFCYERKNLRGHFTGSAWVTNSSRNQVLLLHHAKLDRWLQPGGHADGEKDLLKVAKKELQEETGVEDFLQVNPEIFDIDIHVIPARKNVPEHEHFDVRFHLIVEEHISLKINEESKALRWVALDSVIKLTNYETSFERMVNKTKAL
ncbi:MAG: NUDIX hydrolase [Bacteroidota bacterium]